MKMLRKRKRRRRRRRRRVLQLNVAAKTHILLKEAGLDFQDPGQDIIWV
jgi:hypothetical protein